MHQSNKVKHLTFCIVGIIIGLFITEALIRLFPPTTIKERLRRLIGERKVTCIASDPVLHHRLIPNCHGVMKSLDFETEVKTNSLGLREKEITTPKPEGIYRVLILGDSFAQGWGIDQSNRFSDLAQQELQQQGREDLEIVNAGVNSYSPILELEYLKTEGLKLNPDLVVSLLDFSDLHDDYFYGGWERHDKLRQELFPASIEPITDSVRRPNYWFNWLLDHSKLAHYFYTKIATFWFNRHHQLAWENLSTDIFIYERAMEWPGYRQAWFLPTANLRLMKELLDRQGITLRVVIAPRGLFFEGEWEKGREISGFKPTVAYDWLPITMIETNLNQAGVATTNWYQAFEAAKETEALFYDLDGHWTEKGNAIASQELAKLILKQASLSSMMKPVGEYE